MLHDAGNKGRSEGLSASPLEKMGGGTRGLGPLLFVLAAHRALAACVDDPTKPPDYCADINQAACQTPAFGPFCKKTCAFCSDDASPAHTKATTTDQPSTHPPPPPASQRAPDHHPPPPPSPRPKTSISPSSSPSPTPSTHTTTPTTGSHGVSKTLNECYSEADLLPPAERTAKRNQCTRMYAPHPPPPPVPFGVYGKDGPTKDTGWGKFWTFCLVAGIFYCGYTVYKRQSHPRGGSGGLGGRSDGEGITLLGCMPRRRVSNFISDMQERRSTGTGLASKDAYAHNLDDDDAML